MLQPMSGSVAVVTGAARARGIGRAVALRLAEMGANIVVVGRPGATVHAHEREAGWTGLESLVDEIGTRGADAIAVTADVTRAGDAEAIVVTALDRFGRVDVLVNNAGAGRFGSLLVDLPLDEWRRVIDANLTGTFLVSQAAARVMIAGGRGGSIVNVTSVAGRAGAAHMGAYSPAKFGVIGLTQVLAAELADHAIRVNAVAPGAIDTDLEDATLDGVGREFGVEVDRARAARVRRVSLGRLGTPDEAADAIAYLASPLASFVTGQTLNVSGGLPYS